MATTKPNFNSQPREGGWLGRMADNLEAVAFQLTAARRRLVVFSIRLLLKKYFNSQPREGGWFVQRRSIVVYMDFNSQPREGGWLC